MAYVSLYRRFRSQRFEQIVGQDHVKTALTNAIAADTVGHAYLFSGPRGTGKTSMARILAKALNCENLSDGEPCAECEVCKSIENGTSLDVYELDAASNNSVDDVRQLVASTALGGAGRTKVYVLDEVHMLSKAASNALLKTLEEPPEHVVFVLATTDPQKVLPTIRSRTQHFEFRLLAAEDLASHVRMIIESAELGVADDLVDEIVRRGAGSARDTLSVLDQVAAAGGVSDSSADVDEIVAALVSNDVAEVLGAVATATTGGADPRELGESLTRQLRDMFLVVMGVGGNELPDAVRQRLSAQAKALGAAKTVKAMEAIGSALTEMRQATDARLTLEVALIQLTGVAAAETVQSEAVPAVQPAASSESVATPSPAPAPQESVPERQAPVAEPRRVGSPAAAAREALKASSAPPTPSSARRSAKPAKPAPKVEVPKEVVPVVDAPDPAPNPAPANVDTSSGSAPSLEQLNSDFQERLLPQMSPKTRALYSAGKFESFGEGKAAFSLPNGPHMARCESTRSDVEAILAAHYGADFAVSLMIEGGVVPQRRVERSSAPLLESEEQVDIDSLEDAGDVADPGLQAFQEAFPGAKLESDGAE